MAEQLRRPAQALTTTKARSRPPLPPAGYLWTNAAAGGVSMRNFGYLANNRQAEPPTGRTQIDACAIRCSAKVTNRNYRGFDLDYPDVERAKVFLAELAEYEKSGQMPRLMFMRLGNDHTSGTAAGKIAPLSPCADNDYALGMLVEGVLEEPLLDEDGHLRAGRRRAERPRPRGFAPLAGVRDFALYASAHAVDSTMYNTTSMLRTMELILGLRPMTHFDAGARPMTGAFQATADPTPYTAEKPRIPLDERNPAASATAARSARLDFSEDDRIDDDELNDILWPAIRNSDPPPPVRSFLRAIARMRPYPSLLSLAHASAVLQGPVLGRVQAAVDAHARAQGLLRHGRDSGGISAGAPDLQPGAFDDGAGGRVRLAARRAIRFSDLALKPAEDLTEAEQKFLLQHFFHANPPRMIYRYPRYGETVRGWLASAHNAERARPRFGAQDFRDLQVLSQLAWFDEEFQAPDPEVRELLAKGPRLQRWTIRS